MTTTTADAVVRDGGLSDKDVAAARSRLLPWRAGC